MLTRELIAVFRELYETHKLRIVKHLEWNGSSLSEILFSNIPGDNTKIISTKEKMVSRPRYEACNSRLKV